MAQLLILVIHDPGKVAEVVQVWLEAGAAGMTIFDSSGWAHSVETSGIRDDLPLFPSVRSVLLDSEHTNRTLMSVVSDRVDIDALVAKTEAVIGKLDDPDTGILIVLPVTQAKGLRG